ncbi:MAG: ATP-binding protein, partial [Mycoplasmatales bacterium]|nr:ATP-binding protein [Mycoplasmatales bacterium]
QYLYNYVRFKSFNIKFEDGNEISVENKNVIKSIDEIESNIPIYQINKFNEIIKRLKNFEDQYSEIWNFFNINLDMNSEDFATELQNKIWEIENNEIWTNNTFNRNNFFNLKEINLKNELVQNFKLLLSHLNAANHSKQNKSNENLKKSSEIIKKIFPNDNLLYVSIFRNARDFVGTNGSSNTMNANLINYELSKPNIEEIIHEIYENIQKEIRNMKTNFFNDLVEWNQDNTQELSKNEIKEIKEIGDNIQDQSFKKLSCKLEKNDDFKNISSNSLKRMLFNYNLKFKETISRINKWIKESNKFLNNKEISWKENSFFVSIDNKRHKFEEKFFSAGEKNLLKLLENIIINRPKLLIIDEPEISLSIKWQTLLAELISGIKGTQFIVITHSPYMITNDDVEFLEKIELWRE